jgi:hypothetical protein
VGGEPCFLIFNHLRGFFADVADGFEGQLAREIVGGVFRRLLEIGSPALGGFEKFGQCFADVVVTGAVVVEIIVQLVGDAGELFEEVVGVLFAAGFARVSVKIKDRLVSGVEKLDEDRDAIVGDVGRLAELFDLALREGVVAVLGVERQNESEEKNEREREPTKHGFPVS